MGFLDKLKDTFQQITGGAGNMQLALGSTQIKRGESLSFTATLSATGNLKGKSITAEVYATEHIKYQVDVPNTTSSTASGAVGAAAGTSTATVTTHSEDRTKDNQTYTAKVVLAQNEITMNEGQSQQFSGSIQIPATAQPTYMGTDAQHTWKLRVYLDVPMGADITGEADFVVN